MKTLLVDAGNSSLKWALLENGELSQQQRFFYHGQPPIQQFQGLLKNKLDSGDEVVMVSVLGDEFNHQAHSLTSQASLKFRQIKSLKNLAGVTTAYNEPQKLGADRFVGLIGAYHIVKSEKQPKKGCIIIDSGTATTIDAIDANGQHLGGLILPGLQLCTNSLLENTQLLPQWNNQGVEIAPELFSTETTQAITSASIFGLAGAIDSISIKMEKEIINRTEQTSCTESTSVKKILCGGSAEQILPYMESDYQLQNDLLMIGLKVITESERDY